MFHPVDTLVYQMVFYVHRKMCQKDLLLLTVSQPLEYDSEHFQVSYGVILIIIGFKYLTPLFTKGTVPPVK